VGENLGRNAASLVAVLMVTACASRPRPVEGIEAFHALQEALRAGDGPVVFAMLAPPVRAEWLATHPGDDDPAQRWTRHLNDPESGWPAIAEAELQHASQPAPGTTDLELLLPDGTTTTLRLRRVNHDWFLLTARTVPR